MADLDILNYALTIEYLESNMYKQALATGQLSGPALGLAQEFGQHEQQHADALAATIQKLGGTPVQPRQSYNFPFSGADQAAIMQFISKIEDTGVGAYLGQVANIQSPDVLGAAASIYPVEGEHTAAIRVLLGTDANPTGAFDKPLTMAQVLAAAGPLLGPAAGAAPSTGSTAQTPAQIPAQMPNTGGGGMAGQRLASYAAIAAGAAVVAGAAAVRRHGGEEAKYTSTELQ